MPIYLTRGRRGQLRLASWIQTLLSPPGQKIEACMVQEFSRVADALLEVTASIFRTDTSTCHLMMAVGGAERSGTLSRRVAMLAKVRVQAPSAVHTSPCLAMSVGLNPSFPRVKDRK
jgi:hypothetical protein